jgi:NADH-quinone oxidoreductase subunit J
METLLFSILAVLSVSFAIVVITHPNPVYSALFLVLDLLCIAFLYLLLDSPLLAMVQVIVYAGAIMVLFLFVIMLLNLRREQFDIHGRRFQRFLGAVFGLLLGLQVVAAIRVGTLGTATPQPGAAVAADVHVVGKALFTHYLLFFEVTSILLLVAIIGVMVLGKKELD